MNKKTGIGLLLVVTFLFFSCTQEDRNTGNGTVRLKVATNTELDNVLTRGLEESTPDVNDFSVTISKGEETVGYWDSFGDFPGEYSLSQGTYQLTAAYGDIDKEGFDLPYFEGNAPFAITKGETTEAEVTCYLANTKVTIEYTENFCNYFTVYEASIQSSQNNTIAFSATEERAAYIKPGVFRVYAKVTRAGGSAVTMEVASLEALARQHYKLKMDVDAGNALLNISFSDETERVPIQIDISDEALNAPVPFFATTGFESGITLSAVEGSLVKDVPELSVMLNAQAGISKIQFFTDSKALLEWGWPAEVDILDTDAQTLQRMKELGLKTRGLNYNIDKIAILDFTDIVSYFRIMDGVDQAAIKVVAVDKYSRVNDQELTLCIKSIDNQLSLGQPDPIVTGSDRFQVSVVLDGDPSQLAFQYYVYGMWQAAVSTQVISSEDTNHIVEVVVPYSINNEVNIRSSYVGKISNEVMVTLTFPIYEVKPLSEGDIWATKATLHVIGENEGTTESLKSKDIIVQYSKDDGVSWITPAQTKNRDVITITGLPADPDQENTYKIKAGYWAGNTFVEAVSECEITTEKALQIPNSDFEEWAADNTITSNWTRWYLNAEKNETVSGWCSVNAITAADRSSNAYQSNSGTRRTTTANSGTYAAEIITLGWGANNKMSITSVTVDSITAGELFLGKIGQSNNPLYGYVFNSRPSAVSFYYSYAGKGTGQFNVKVQVKSGEIIIGENELSGGSVSTYTLETLDIMYKQEFLSLKATEISIIFSSGDNLSNEINKASWGVSGNSVKEHTGNKLYIDDVKLEY